MEINGFRSLYNKEHAVQIYNNDHAFVEETVVNIQIRNYQHNTLQIKARDMSNFMFNYTANIDTESFQHMRKEQCLEITFDELGTHLLEMLGLHHKKEMLLKFHLQSDACKLIFFEKSKIKSLVFLSIDMLLTNQKEIFEEMNSQIVNLQDTNRMLVKQLSSTNDKIHNKEELIAQQRSSLARLEDKFRQELIRIDDVYTDSLKRCESLISNRLLTLSVKVLKLMNDVGVIKTESNLKSASSARLMQSMENLRIESLENVTLINQLRRDNANLEKINREQETEIERLRKVEQDGEKEIAVMQQKMDEYRKDLENSAYIIAKKTELYEELRNDMEQANQLIRSYTKHYDLKASEVEELQEAIKQKDVYIKEQILENNQLFKNFQEYKVKYNSGELEKLKQEICVANARIEVLEKEKRETLKLNGLLSKKLSAMNLEFSN